MRQHVLTVYGPNQDDFNVFKSGKLMQRVQEKVCSQISCQTVFPMNGFIGDLIHRKDTKSTSRLQYKLRPRGLGVFMSSWQAYSIWLPCQDLHFSPKLIPLISRNHMPKIENPCSVLLYLVRRYKVPSCTPMSLTSVMFGEDLVWPCERAQVFQLKRP